MTLTFTLPTTVEAPTYGSSVKAISRKLVTAFGDGYRQRIRDGINSQSEDWSLQFNNLSDADAKTIMNFFIARGEVESFWWTNPDGDTKLYTAENAAKTFNQYSSNSITVTFVEDLNG